MSHDRESLAAVAARIIVESELTDWQLARRKAAAQLGLGAHGTPQPSDDEIIAEIATYQSLYGGDGWHAQLRAQREYALEAMQALARFDPVLVGPVAEGWAHAGSGIRLELSPENPKEVEYTLIDLGVDFTPTLARDGTALYEIVDGDWPMRLVVPSGRAAADARHKRRLRPVQLKQLLASSDV
ncbi:MAG: hypothetical protein JNL19_07630 [Burkholderiales bacterium]|nr:hypothetical protein [Burkholderiales bacterium]